MIDRATHHSFSRRTSPRRVGTRHVLLAALAAAPLLGFYPGSGRSSSSTSSLLGPSSARAAEPNRSTEEEPVPPEVRGAVDKGLAWLAKNQQADGSWEQGSTSSTAVPSLAVMAFLARGHMPGQGRYGDVINKAIDYVLSCQGEKGLISKGEHGNAAMYEHGISTSMLSEAFGMVDDTRKQRIEKALARAVQLILDAQHPGGKEKPMPHTGGWRYQPTQADADISVSGWQLMALRGAANCGATVPKSALEAGREYIRRCAYKGDEGGFTYEAAKGPPNAARTGTGIVALEMLGEHSSKEATKGGDYLLAHIPDNPQSGEFYYYAVYYDSQALFQLGDKYWETGYPKLVATLLAGQDDRGVWAQGGGQEQQAGEAYRTSMAILALCVPFRYLPLYQK